MQFKNSVTIAKFLVFLDELRRRYFFDDLVLYFDNLQIHRSKVVKERLDLLGIAYIYGPAYSPDLNGVEFVFSGAKHLVKKWRHQALQMKLKWNLKKAIYDAFDKIDVLKIKSCI